MSERGEAPVFFAREQVTRDRVRERFHRRAVSPALVLADPLLDIGAERIEASRRIARGPHVGDRLGDLVDGLRLREPVEVEREVARAFEAPELQAARAVASEAAARHEPAAGGEYDRLPSARLHRLGMRPERDRRTEPSSGPQDRGVALEEPRDGHHIGVGRSGLDRADVARGVVGQVHEPQTEPRGRRRAQGGLPGAWRPEEEHDGGSRHAAKLPDRAPARQPWSVAARPCRTGRNFTLKETEIRQRSGTFVPERA